jgi:hypothetical protein
LRAGLEALEVLEQLEAAGRGVAEAEGAEEAEGLAVGLAEGLAEVVAEEVEVEVEVEVEEAVEEAVAVAAAVAGLAELPKMAQVVPGNRATAVTHKEAQAMEPGPDELVRLDSKLLAERR